MADSSRRRATASERKRLAVRDTLWPDAESRIWSRKRSVGFVAIPRVLPLVLLAISDLSEGRDASKVYLDLWCRLFDEALIDRVDPELFAYSSGYKGSRAERTWRERMNILRDLGFIDFRGRANEDIGYVIVWDPVEVVKRLHAEGKVDDRWWTTFVGRAAEVGTELIAPDDKAGTESESPGSTGVESTS